MIFVWLLVFRDRVAAMLSDAAQPPVQHDSIAGQLNGDDARLLLDIFLRHRALRHSAEHCHAYCSGAAAATRSNRMAPPSAPITASTTTAVACAAAALSEVVDDAPLPLGVARVGAAVLTVGAPVGLYVSPTAVGALVVGCFVGCCVAPPAAPPPRSASERSPRT